MRKCQNRKRNNRGSAMVVIIVVIAFVSILISTMFTLTTMNIQMKSVDRKAKGNFYSAEGALEQINLGLQNEISDASKDAYTTVMQNYAGISLETERRLKFNEKLFNDIILALREGTTSDKYDLNKLRLFLTSEVSAHTSLYSSDGLCKMELATTKDSLVLKDLVVEYTDADGFKTIVETDIRLTAPNMNLIQPADMPDIFEYAIIANHGLQGEDVGNVEFGANVYAGKGELLDSAGVLMPDTGMNLPNGATNFADAKRIVVNGEVKIPTTATMNINTDMDFWAKELMVSGGKLATRGRTYVSNDLLITEKNSDVTLDGEYYGFGNGQLLVDGSETIVPAGGDRSAILINGTQTKLDMSNIRKLLLSGSAQIATGDVTFNADEFDGVLPDNDPSYNDLIEMDRPVIFAGAKLDYTIQCVPTGMLAQSGPLGLQALTPPDTALSNTSPERFLIINNSDGTISFKDRVNFKFVGVRQDGNAELIANMSDNDSEITRFKVYPLKGMPGCYAIYSVGNAKYVGVQDIDGTEKLLCASFDKVTDGYQLFHILHAGDSAPEPEPEVPDTQDSFLTFTVANTSVTTISFAPKEWGDNTKDTPVSAKIEINLWGSVSAPITMNLADGNTRAYYVLSQNSGTKDFWFKITYTLKDGTVKTYENTYNPDNHNVIGAGNSELLNNTFAPGIYIWSKDTFASKGDSAKLNAGTGVLEFTGQNPQNITNNDVKDLSIRFILTNNDDGTISMRSIAEETKYKYLSVQPDGKTIKATASTIGPNEKFTVEFYRNNMGNETFIKTSPQSYAGGKYLMVPVGSSELQFSADNPNNDNVNERPYTFFFQWIGYKDNSAPIIPEGTDPNDKPIVGMQYQSETTALGRFFSPHWVSGGANQNLTIHYMVYDKDGNLKADHSAGEYRTVSGSELTQKFVVEDLDHLDKVVYRFHYSYKDGDRNVSNQLTSTYTYIHEQKQGSGIHVSDVNEDIILGESVEIKSNQIAYLVPADCVGVNDGITIIGKNPMSAAEYVRLKTCADNTAKYPHFEEVSFTKEIEGVGAKLGDYLGTTRTETNAYKPVFVPTSDGTMVYLYLNFDADNQAKFFEDYYAKNKDSMQEYMQEYVDKITLSPYFARVTTDGNLLGSAEDGSNIYVEPKIKIDPSALSGLRNEETGYQKRYRALSKKLILDYTDLSTTEKGRELFDNLIRYDSSAPGGSAFAGMSAAPVTYETEDGIKAVIVNNESGVPYVYDGDPTGKVCLILATGDVVLEQDFSGIVIARGTVTVKNAAVNDVYGNKPNLVKILQTKMDPTNPASKTLIAHYFIDGEKYVLDDGDTGADLGTGDYIALEELVTYEEWTKR